MRATRGREWAFDPRHGSDAGGEPRAPAPSGSVETAVRPVAGERRVAGESARIEKGPLLRLFPNLANKPGVSSYESPLYGACPADVRIFDPLRKVATSCTCALHVSALFSCR